jgi:hypothetical protein
MNIIAATHNTRFCYVFRPALLVAFEFIETCGKCADRGLGSKANFEPKPVSDFMNDAYTRVDMPEVSCNEVELPDIIVTPFDETLFTTNTNLALNFGTGALATATETRTRVLVHRGYVYDMSGGGAASTSITLDGKTYYIRVAADAVDGKGSIRYTYENGRGQFIAGPNGQASFPDDDGFGTGQGARISRANYVRAADFLGIKLFKEAKFSVEQSEIQKYSSRHVLNTRTLRMQKTAQREAFDAMIGHEVPYDSPAETLTSLGGVQPSGLGEGLPSTLYTREYRRLGSGLQTPKPVQPTTRLVIPMFFQHNLDRSQSLITAVIPDADIEYEVELSRLDELYFPCAGDLFIHEEVKLYPDPVGDDVAADGARPIEIASRRIPIVLPDSKVQEPANYNLNLALISEQLYVDEPVHLILISRVVFEMIRIYKDYSFNISTEEENCYEICNSKFPVEYTLVRDVPTANIDQKDYRHARNWARLGHVIETPTSKYLHVQRNIGDGAGGDNYELRHDEIHYDLTERYEPVIDTLSVKVNGSYYYEKLPRRFFELYLPWVYSCGNWYHDGTQGLNPLLVNFSQMPGVSQNWGAAAISRNRKLELELTAQLSPSTSYQLDGVIGGSPFNEEPKYTKATIYTTSSEINYTLSTDGTMSNRFC